MFVLIVYSPLYGKGCYRSKIDSYIELNAHIARIKSSLGDNTSLILRTGQLCDYVVNDSDLSLIYMILQ